ncbi:MAG: A/G-specific adenine glycosylase, partial [Alphaproteobacteria bacterium]|nr:A/G-specific adenine glycosylase [Alphaproteobacteria bacterium]
MPWRAVKPDRPDPYRVWLSEIMLQQTTVATVRPYYLKFIRRWPTLKDLASASLDDILRMWAGLGYYRRARLLHKCARMLVKSFGTTFPADERMLLELPGFGPYTAAAVAAIAFDLPANVVDGNVERVMSRMFMVEEPLPKAKPVLRAV